MGAVVQYCEREEQQEEKSKQRRELGQLALRKQDETWSAQREWEDLQPERSDQGGSERVGAPVAAFVLARWGGCRGGNAEGGLGRGWGGRGSGGMGRRGDGWRRGGGRS